MLETTASLPAERLPLKAVPFVLFHLAAIPVAILAGFSWTALAWLVGMYYGRMLFVCIAYHRYFSHRTFQTGRIRQFLLAFCAETTVQKGVLWWAAHHRRHHRFSDQQGDPHSPILRGFWWSHVGWIVSKTTDETEFDRIKDFARFPELRFLNTHYWLPPTVLAVALFLVGGWTAFAWGFVVSTVVLWHGTFTINSLAHVIGRRRFETTDESRNSLLLALITCGEGWHNNHHRHQHSAAQGFYWWQVDFAYYVIRAAAWLGLVRNVVKPTPDILEEGRRGIVLRPATVGAGPLQSLEAEPALVIDVPGALPRPVAVAAAD